VAKIIDEKYWKPYREYVESPCINICTLVDNGLEDVCVGCGRTAEEIEAYPTLTNEQKSDVNKDALLRLETL
jgi:predicted Fe-S protein YdhL (DUF1289 family)|tara:strand:+ start:166 stop:381 length:216 start_codon:yes stop_codon:yes gene_type:complete